MRGGACAGCHEEKSASPSAVPVLTRAMQVGPQPLEPFYGPPRGFSFAREIQPILERHCVACHDRQALAKGESTVSLEGAGELDKRAKKSWSDAYKALADPKFCNWVSPQSAPPMLPPYSAGAAKSKLIAMLEAGHEDVKLSREEMEKIACWIDLGVPFSGDYTEGMDPGQVPAYERWLRKRRHWEPEERKSIEALIRAMTGR